ncbi:hypothetical protein HLB44_08625 [Aquincola sp. S2]|uniref:Uncharacterized protein n=1 Tax=Pseudaquabacterium terrae TaxID=2732868 RepID=A0ABX2EEL3_9BURK|nr:DUF6506 family protein [Aquabacterium terrae]NRF67043.1 hypothetical protein [Aquabacterium terrae]
MALQSFGFIVAGNGFNPATHRSTMQSEQFTMLAVGVSQPAEAPAVAREMVEAGVQLIELCGAFGAADTARVQQAVPESVPVGAVSYGGAAIGALHRLVAA